MRIRAKAVVRFDTGLAMSLHSKCRKSVAKFKTSLFEVLTLLRVRLMCSSLAPRAPCASFSFRLLIQGGWRGWYGSERLHPGSRLSTPCAACS